MRNDTKRVVGVVLLISAFVIAGLGFVLLNSARAEAEDEEIANGYTRALGGAAPDNVEPDRTPATVAWVTSGAALVVGAVFLASTSAPSNHSAD